MLRRNSLALTSVDLLCRFYVPVFVLSFSESFCITFLPFPGVQDSVRCYHCGGGLRNWEPGDDPMVEHAKWYPACHHVLITKEKMFFRKVEDGDNPEDDTPSMVHTIKHVSYKTKLTEDVRSDSLNTAVQVVIENGYSKENAMRAISVIRIKNDKQQSLLFVQHVLSPTGPHAKITAADIASILLEAEGDPNFFLSFGVQDRARCYYCGGGLRNWEPGDDPMVEHAKWYPACHHVLITKGKMFFRKVEDGDNPEDDTPSMVHTIKHVSYETKLTEDVRSDSLNSAVQAVIENGYPKEDAMRAISSLFCFIMKSVNYLVRDEEHKQEPDARTMNNTGKPDGRNAIIL
ncbi:BIR7B-like protein [Mya arenaria]|uniref:BIR7B-like protein n=1 Tax=Mya arenaria TaxID=6604 RepID=A0ABY7EKR6_MYAAR|nr:BIR7B-like protein [Mya arenaria]